MQRIAFTGLLKIEFPAYDLLLCDGAFFDWGADRYLSKDATFGVIGGMETISEGVGEEVPVRELTLLPPSATPTSTLAAPGYQTSRVRLWLAEYDYDTGLLIGSPSRPELDAQVDQIALAFGPGTRTMAVTVAPNTARLIERNIGNSLNSAWHKSIWTGETGHDNADGLGRQIAWGVVSG